LTSFFSLQYHVHTHTHTTNKHTEEARKNATFFSEYKADSYKDRIRYKAVRNLGRIHLDRVQRRLEKQAENRKREDKERIELEKRVELSLNKLFSEAYESTGIVLDHQVVNPRK